MAPWTWALIIIVVIVIVAALAALTRRQRSTSLRKRFGPEYDRTVAATDDRRTAETQLEERAKRSAQLNIVPLPEPVRDRYASEWRELQEQFVDRPSEVVSAADNLLTRVMQDRGYPIADVDQQAELVSVDHPGVVENYRVATAIHRRNQSQQASTEDLREALLRYRSLFDDLLRTDGQGTPVATHHAAGNPDADPDLGSAVERDPAAGQAPASMNARQEQR
jgi:hypothetical protein